MTVYRAYFQKASTLSDARRQQMAEIYFQFYTGSDVPRFIADLQNKDEVLILEYQGQMVGFSCLQFYVRQQHLIVYSGDTIVMPEHWTQQTLHRAWIRRMALLREQRPQQKIYWFLLVKGLRTWKYLKTFVRTFYPHWQREEPELRSLAQALAAEKFGALFNPQRGVVECPSHFGHLNATLAAIPPAQHHKPEVDFFLRKNPHYARGHELVCLCEISPENVTARCQPLFINPQVEFYDD